MAAGESRRVVIWAESSLAAALVSLFGANKITVCTSARPFAHHVTHCIRTRTFQGASGFMTSSEHARESLVLAVSFLTINAFPARVVIPAQRAWQGLGTVLGGLSSQP